MVQPYGVPNSSFRAYRLPILAPEASTLEATPARRSLAAIDGYHQHHTPLPHGTWLHCSHISLISGVNSELALRGTIKHLMGATTGGSDSTCDKVQSAFAF